MKPDRSLPAIDVQDLTVKLGAVVALDRVSLKVPQGKWTAVVGPNGAGKSTLLRSLAGLQGKQAAVSLAGVAFTEMSRRESAKKISWLGQNERISGDMSAYDVVMLGRLPYQSWLDSPTEYDHHIVTNSLKMMRALALKDRSIAELSGGEQQRVFIARALAVEADIMLMDEPFNHLDPHHQSDCLQLIQNIVLQGTTVITVLHDIGFALYADEMIVMDKGLIVYQGSNHDPKTHEQIKQVFENRIDIQLFMDRVVVFPV